MLQKTTYANLLLKRNGILWLCRKKVKLVFRVVHFSDLQFRGTDNMEILNALLQIAQHARQNMQKKTYIRDMTPIAGIEIEKNAKGQDAFIRIDLKKYKKQLQPFLREVGLMDDEAFEQEWKSSLTIEDAKAQSLTKIREWWKK